MFYKKVLQLTTTERSQLTLTKLLLKTHSAINLLYAKELISIIILIIITIQI